MKGRQWKVRQPGGSKNDPSLVEKSAFSGKIEDVDKPEAV